MTNKIINKKLTKQALKEEVLNKGYISLDKGKLYFVVSLLNETNFNMTSGFKQQLKEEGKMGMWVGFISSTSQGPFGMETLPIYGSSSKYITTYFYTTASITIDTYLEDRQMELLKRANNK